MHTIEVVNKKIRIDVPEEWNEMTAAQVEYIFKLYSSLAAGSLLIGDFKARVVLHFIPTHLSIKTITKQLNGQSSEVAEAVVQLYDTLFSYLLINNSGVYLLNYNSPVQFFPVINKSIGPGTLLSGMKYGNFIVACSMMAAIDNFGIDTFVKHLYPGLNINKVAEWQKAWVIMWFRSCLLQISDGTVCVDGRDVNFKVLFSSGNNTRSSSTDTNTDPWRSVMYIVAQNGAFGDVENVKNAELYDVLMYLLKMYNDAKTK